MRPSNAVDPETHREVKHHSMAEKLLTVLVHVIRVVSCVNRDVCVLFLCVGS